MITLGVFAVSLSLLGATPEPAAPATPPPTNEVCVILGAPGDDAFEPGFAAAVKTWQDTCAKAGIPCAIIGLDDQKDADPVKNTLDRDQLHDWINHLDANATAPVWIVYLGHGTFDGKDARMNFRGEDLSAAELGTWLKPVSRPLVFIHGGSASSPFINALSARNRVIVTATQSGREVDYARLGEKFAEALNDPIADLDQDGEVSVLEAFVTANHRVQDFYTENDRMATEHALVDDNGDKRGTPAAWFQGLRLTRRPQGNVAPDGEFARNIALVPSAAELALTPADLQQRADLEKQIEALREQKADMSEADYYATLEKIAKRLEAIYVKPATAPVAAPVAAPAPAPKS